MFRVPSRDWEDARRSDLLGKAMLGLIDPNTQRSFDDVVRQGGGAV